MTEPRRSTSQPSTSRPSTSQPPSDTRPFDHRPFIPLLQMPLVQHKISTVKKNEKPPDLKCICHENVVPYYESCGTALKKLGLYHISQVGHKRRDKRLITASIEQWTPETHTFHLHVGEMTVTLQDVSCIWGFPIPGMLVTRVSYYAWSPLVQRCLGRVPGDKAWKQNWIKIRGGKKVKRSSKYSLSLKWLRKKYAKMSENLTLEHVDFHTRAYILNLFGSVMFSDSSEDNVPTMYLQFFGDLRDPPLYNWEVSF